MSVATIAGTARTLLRDFPKFFEIEVGPLNVLTIRLPHPLIAPSSVQVFVGSAGTDSDDPWGAVATTAWALDERNGLLKLTDQSLLGKRVLISAYHYTWFADSDLLLHSKQSADETLYNTTHDYDDIESGIYGQVTAMGAVVRALWSLSLELMLDIDVSTPEGINIPARQRYGQVLQMMQYWENEYTTRANALNIGLGALEQFRLRRVAYLTNRYVPVYQEREADDPRWPYRLFPPIPDGMLGPGEGPADDEDIVEIMEEGEKPQYPRPGRYPYPYGTRNEVGIGWTAIGTRGDIP